MLAEFHVTAESYREAIQDEASMGRVPMARLIWGYVEGKGWAFLRPWEQLAMFPEKATVAGIYSPRRKHVRFWIRRLRPVQGIYRNQMHLYPVTGRFWRGVAWRDGWRRPRLVLLDPDIVDDDPNAHADYGELDAAVSFGRHS